MNLKTAFAFNIAMGEIGVKEVNGTGNNPRVLEYHQATSLKASDDETSWCSSFMNFCFLRAGLKGSGRADAKSWLTIGIEVTEPELGDVVILWRGSPDSWMGHVGFYAGRDGDNIILLGGNQGDRVCYQSFPKSRLIGYRRV